MDSTITEFSDLPLLTLNEEGTAPATRVKDLKSAREIFENLKLGDKVSAINRARVQAMFDGTPPYSDAQLRASGQGFRTNLNFGEGEAQLEKAMSAYVDLVNSVEQIALISLRMPEAENKNEWETIISEEFTHQLRSWSRFNFEFMNLCTHFVGHGVGLNFHEDCVSWKWKSSGLGDFLIPRGTDATEEAVEVACARREVTVSELYRYIRHDGAALGWNVPMVKKAIKAACSNRNSTDSWEELQAELKCNDLNVTGKASKIKLVHMWVQEFSGTVSHLIFTEGTNQTGDIEDFLYKQVNKYESITQAFRFFTYGIGTNGKFHGVRGLGFKVFPHQQLNNRIRSQAVDSTMLAGAPMVQPKDEISLESLSFSYFGPFAILPPNVEFVDRAAPNVSQTMMPMLNDLTRLANARAGQYMSSGVFEGQEQRRSRFEVAAHLEEASNLSETAMNLFYGPWGGHIMEVVRRFFSPDYPSYADGYGEVMECRQRCIERGVPEDAWGRVDVAKTRIVRAIGNGSGSLRTLKLQKLNTLAGSYDAIGRHNLFRDQTVAEVGRDMANRYIPANTETRMGMHGKVAQLETMALLSGQQIEVLPDEVHDIHLELHLPKLEELFARVEAGEMTEAEAVIPAQPLFEHCVKHLESIQGDVFLEDKVGMYNQRLQQVSELIINGQKALAKQQREAEENPEAQGQGQGQVSPEMMAKMEEHKMKLQMMQEKFQMESMIKLQKHQQELNLQDAKTAASVRDLLK